MVHANKVEKSDLEMPKLLYFALDRKMENLVRRELSVGKMTNREIEVEH